MQMMQEDGEDGRGYITVKEVLMKGYKTKDKGLTPQHGESSKTRNYLGGYIMGKIIGIDLGTTNSCVAVMGPEACRDSQRRGSETDIVRSRVYKKTMSGLWVNRWQSGRRSQTTEYRCIH